LLRFRVRVQIQCISENYVAINGHPNKGESLMHELSAVEKGCGTMWVKAFRQLHDVYNIIVSARVESIN